MNFLKYKLVWLLVILLCTPSTQAMPNIKTEFGYSLEGFLRVKVENLTTRELACYVAIDGRKVKFRLPPRLISRWYKTTDKRYTKENFSIWCDYIEFHPEYRKYSN